MDTENVNKSPAEPRFNVGDVVYTPTLGRDMKDNRIYIQTKVLATVFARGNGKTLFFGYKTLDNESEAVKKPNRVFSTKEECEAYLDECEKI